VGTSTLATAAAPAASAVTLGTSASAGAPAATYYSVVTYSASGAQSVPSQVFIQNVAAGNLPTIVVASAGAPAAADHFVVYMGLSPGSLSMQQAALTTTALGATFTAANPLTNSVGWNRSVTNPSANIVGLACDASNENFFDGTGGSFNVGPGSRLGADTSVPPLTPFEAQGAYVIGLGGGTTIEMNLINTTAYYPSLLGTTAGIALDSTTGFFIVDPAQSNKTVTIVGQRDGVYIGPTSPGTVGDLGARVIVQFTSGLLYS
jgi:hypothetical protein